MKKYSRFFSSFYCRTMLRYFALPYSLSPSSSKTKSCFSTSHNFKTGFKIWLMYTGSDILPFLLPGALEKACPTLSCIRLRPSNESASHPLVLGISTRRWQDSSIPLPTSVYEYLLCISLLRPFSECTSSPSFL